MHENYACAHVTVLGLSCGGTLFRRACMDCAVALQGDGTEADKVAELRAGMDARTFTSVELTNYKPDKK